MRGAVQADDPRGRRGVVVAWAWARDEGGKVGVVKWLNG